MSGDFVYHISCKNSQFSAEHLIGNFCSQTHSIPRIPLLSLLLLSLLLLLPSLITDSDGHDGAGLWVDGEPLRVTMPSGIQLVATQEWISDPKWPLRFRMESPLLLLNLSSCDRGDGIGNDAETMPGFPPSCLREGKVEGWGCSQPLILRSPRS